MVESGGGERRTSKIRVENDASGVDDGAERVAQRLAELVLDSDGQACQGEIEGFFVEMAGGDFLRR